MAKLSELRKQAKALGIAPAVIRSATTAEELSSVIADHNAHDGGSTVVRAKAKAKGKSGSKTTVRKSNRKATVAKVHSQKRNSGRKASTPAKSRKSGTAKRSSTKSTSSYVPKGGRNVLDDVDFSFTDGWNPRDGSAPDVIVKALRKAKGNREKVFEALKADVWDFVGKKYRNGDKRSKDEALEMLRYRIARTAWDFAMRTGQHESASNRVEYGTGGTGMGVWKPAKRKASKTAPATRKSSKGRKTKTAARKSQRGTQGRKKAGSRR